MHVKRTRYTIALLTATLYLATCERLEIHEGASVTLNITGQLDEDDVRVLDWIFNQTTIVEYFEKRVYVRPLYKGRVLFYEDNYSLLLKNLMRNNTGYYKAEKRTFDGPIATVAEYYIHVQENQNENKVPKKHPRERTHVFVTVPAAVLVICIVALLLVRKRGDPQDQSRVSIQVIMGPKNDP